MTVDEEEKIGQYFTGIELEDWKADVHRQRTDHIIRRSQAECKWV